LGRPLPPSLRGLDYDGVTQHAKMHIFYRLFSAA